MKLIEDIYAAFDGVPKAKLLEVCTACCMTESDRRHLLEAPLRRTSRDALWNYPSDAMWTVGDEADFLYFLPRLLELGLSEYERDGRSEGFIAFPETFGKKLALAGYDRWREERQSIVDEAIFQIFRTEILRGDMLQAESWLNAICHVSVSKDRYLSHLDNDEALEAKQYIFRCWNPHCTQTSISGPFWDELSDTQTLPIVKWINDERLSHRDSKDPQR